MADTREKIWIDLENTPHIPFFAPIIRELRKRGFRVVITARDAYQTCELADLYRLPYAKIGRHYGQKLVLKALGLGIRAAQLLGFALRERPALALSHGSRSQVVASNLLRIPTVMIDDYEHSRGVGFGHPRWAIFPRALSRAAPEAYAASRILYYSGIKEDVYAPEFVPNPRLLDQLGLAGRAEVIVTVRPPATEAHYHNRESEILFAHFMARAVQSPGCRVVLLPRNRRQAAEIRQRSPQWFTHSKVLIPDGVVDGLNLLWHSDLVVSGGGTMNREAAALGLPVYSIFRGRIGAVDLQLQAEGRLVLIESVDDVNRKILLQRRNRSGQGPAAPRPALREILAHVEEILRAQRPRP